MAVTKCDHTFGYFDTDNTCADITEIPQHIQQFFKKNICRNTMIFTNILSDNNSNNFKNNVNFAVNYCTFLLCVNKNV